jgi:hypothetical protein
MTERDCGIPDIRDEPVDRVSLLSDLVAALHHRIVRHYRLMRVLSDGIGDDRLVDRMAARVAEAESLALLILEWMKDPAALERDAVVRWDTETPAPWEDGDGK